jgi:uncharacterized phage infection (PIP) family protein YhgE
MAQAAKSLKTLAGTDVNTKDSVSVPLSIAILAVAIKQLQDSVNELIARHNAHQHSALNAVPSVGLVTGTAQTATNLFVNADQ